MGQNGLDHELISVLGGEVGDQIPERPHVHVLQDFVQVALLVETPIELN